MKKVIAVSIFVFLSVMIAAAVSFAKTAGFTGDWNNENAVIVIKNQTAKSFEFYFEGWTDDGNTGELEGVAVIKGAGVALYEEKDEYTDEMVRVKFTLKNGELIVEEENTFGLFGIGVYIGGTYSLLNQAGGAP
jgi:hypothetical protein